MLQIISTTSFSHVFFFFTSNVMFRTLWHHLSSLSHQFSIFKDVGGWQPWVNKTQMRMLGKIHGGTFSKSRQIYLLECSSSSFLFIFHKVTGANKGIGYAIVKKLCKEFSGTVILTGNFGDLVTVLYIVIQFTKTCYNQFGDKLLVLKTLVCALGLAQ